MVDTYKETVANILEDFNLKLSDRFEHGEDFRIFYKNGGDTVNILTVVDSDDDSKLLNQIYGSEAKILKDYMLTEDGDAMKINFRVIPTYGSPLSAIVPTNFKRYNGKQEIKSV